ncbi:MAG: TorF family putative porin [Alphaproteobacteria bacterium]
MAKAIVTALAAGLIFSMIGAAGAQEVQSEPSPHRGTGQTEPATATTSTGPFGGNITGSVSFLTDYAFRGVSQTGRSAAVQGGLEYAYQINTPALELYASIWGSNVKFTDATVELDYTAGVRGAVGDFKYNVNAVYFAYPGAADNLKYNFYEVGGQVAYDLPFATPAVGYRFTPENFGRSGQAHYVYAELNVPINVLPDNKPRIFGHIGRSYIEDNTRFALPDYTDWMVGVGFSAFTLDFALQYVDTSIRKGACGSNACDARAIFSVSRAF